MNEPVYAMVYKVLKREITEGDYPVGGLIPAEPELEKRFAVSRTTIRKAVGMLQREGFLLAQRGFGTVVLEHKAMQNLNVVTSMTDTLKERGYKVDVQDMQIETIFASLKLAQELQIEECEEVIRIYRVLVADSVPIAITENYIPSVKIPNIELRKDEIESLYRFMEERYNLYIEKATDRISARNADAKEAKALDVAIGTALIYIKRVCYQQGKPIIADRVSIIGGRYELEVAMAGKERV